MLLSWQHESCDMRGGSQTELGTEEGYVNERSGGAIDLWVDVQISCERYHRDQCCFPVKDTIHQCKISATQIMIVFPSAMSSGSVLVKLHSEPGPAASLMQRVGHRFGLS